MAKQNSANSQEARALADTARASAERGVDSMNRLSEAVQGIKTSSDETAKIVKTIDEIAFQTNLLALNAAVEAARAGEAGRGFAVVAEEVRNLAMRSAEAAKNTADLIDESVKNAEGGVNTNEEVLSNLAEIREGVNKVGDVMTEIAAGSDQQSEGISQINVAVDQMNKVTQQNAANSEESASAAEELSAQATEMQSLVATYQLSQVQVQGQPQASLQMKGQRAPHAAPAPPLGVRVEPEGQGPNGGLPPNGHGSPDAHDFPLDDEEVATLKEF
jgi:methyl-accepting chemotaxis protein